MRLSVIIPCYNAEDTLAEQLAEQLAALSGQRLGQPRDVLLVNNREAAQGVPPALRDAHVVGDRRLGRSVGQLEGSLKPRVFAA